MQLRVHRTCFTCAIPIDLRCWDLDGLSNGILAPGRLATCTGICSSSCMTGQRALLLEQTVVQQLLLLQQPGVFQLQTD